MFIQVDILNRNYKHYGSCLLIVYVVNDVTMRARDQTFILITVSRIW